MQLVYAICASWAEEDGVEESLQLSFVTLLSKIPLCIIAERLE